MQRTIKPYSTRKASAILCSDFHLREDTPKCWTSGELFQEEQWKSVGYIAGLQKQYDCSVIHAGDLFNHWKPSPWLIGQAIQFLPSSFYTVVGQHDLPQHNLDLIGKCGVQTLHLAQSAILLPGCHFGQAPEGYLPWNNRKILVWHHMTYISKPFPEAKGGMAEGILRKYPQYDLIVTGDNHTSFTVEYEGHRLVNPGNLTRQTADQINYQPRVALWYAEDNSIEWVNIPVMQNVITRDHIEQRQQRDSRIEAFITQLNSDWDAGMSFESNLKKFEQANNIDKEIMEIIYKSIEQ